MNKRKTRAGIGILLAIVMIISMMPPQILGGIKTVDAATDDSAKSQDGNTTSVIYQTHVQTHGWMDEVSDGEMSGTEGEAKRLEAIKIRVESQTSGGITYSVHCQTYGWMDEVSDGELSGTSGEAKRLESIRIHLTGELAEKYDVLYRVHCQTYGWTDWVKNGEDAGTTGEGKRLEGIQIKLVAKNAKKTASIKYTTHVQSYGWLDYVTDGEASGTTGEAKRLEGIKIDVDSDYTGGVHYKVHAQTYGWMDVVRNGMMSGTSGEAKRLEAIEIYLTGDLAKNYNVYYRVHAQTFGWLGWRKGGTYDFVAGFAAGTSGMGKRLEAIEIKLVKKGQSAPKNDADNNNDPYVSVGNYILRNEAEYTGQGNDVVELAKQYLDLPYIYGGANLDKGVDCSGFTLAIYKEFGYSLLHGARAQAKTGVAVALMDLQPGDLVFYKNGKDDIQHVGIYIGGGYMIHASSSKKKVVIAWAFEGTYIDGVYYGGICEDPCTAVRILK